MWVPLTDPISEQERIAALLRELAAGLRANGAIRSTSWQCAFERVPRHLFIPSFYRMGESGSDRVAVTGTDSDQHDEWLSCIYGDHSLVIQFDPTNPARATSSSSQPTLMATMLEALDVKDGANVLEVGTGSGYNAALLCERLGSQLVTTIDIDEQLVADATQRLGIAGYRPTTAVGDGMNGYQPNALYDRIVATYAIAAVPHAWTVQLRPDAVIVAPFWGGIVRLEMAMDRAMVGRFLPTAAYFMGVRDAEVRTPPTSELIELTKIDGGITRGIVVPPDLKSESFWFMARMLLLPPVVLFGGPGQSMYEALRIVHLSDRSWARVDPHDGGHTVTQMGPRQMWDEIEMAYELWAKLGRPDRERFGLTVRRDGSQFVWLDSPDSKHRWELSAGKVGRHAGPLEL